MALNLVTPPTAELITIPELRDHLRCGEDEDDYISRLLKVATTATEHACKRRFAPQVWEQSYDGFPSVIELELAPVREIVSLKYTSTSGVLTTISLPDYRVNMNEPVRVYPKTRSSIWPEVDPEAFNSVVLRYSVGYTPDAEDDDPTAFPEDLKQAILLLAGHLYANREPAVIGAGMVTVDVPKTYDYLINPYRTWLF